MEGLNSKGLNSCWLQDLASSRAQVRTRANGDPPLGWHVAFPTFTLDWGSLYEIISDNNKNKDLLIL